MSKRDWNFWVSTAAVSLLVASFFAGHLFGFAILVLAGAAAIQAGVHGFLPSGYSLGTQRITGWPARLLGGTAIAAGAAFILVVLFALLDAF